MLEDEGTRLNHRRARAREGISERGYRIGAALITRWLHDATVPARLQHYFKVDNVGMNLDVALDTFLDTDASYGGGLANHGPMAAEALAHLGVPQSIGPFVDHYLPRLDAAECEVSPAPTEWRDWLRPRLVGLVGAPESQAGHGLLRVAHAVRGLERAEVLEAPLSVSLRELGTAVADWESGGPIFDQPRDLCGSLEVVEWLDSFERLDAHRRSDGLLTLTLADAGRLPDFAGPVARLASLPTPTATLDALGAGAADRFRRNTGLGAFAILHGTTVSAMSTVLLADPFPGTTASDDGPMAARSR